MTHHLASFRTLFWAAAIGIFLNVHATPAAAETRLGALTISEPWARASIGMAKAGAVFLTIHNDGPTDRLVAAATDVAGTVELHTHIMDGEIMRMRRVEGGIEITGGTETILTPGGLHVMLIGLTAPLAEGDSFPLTLTFETAGTITVDVAVKSMSAMGHGHGHIGHH